MSTIKESKPKQTENDFVVVIVLNIKNCLTFLWHLLMCLSKFLQIFQVLFPHECKESGRLKELTAVEDSMTTMKGSCLLTVLLAGFGVLGILEPAAEDIHCHRAEHPVITYKGKE